MPIKSRVPGVEDTNSVLTIVSSPTPASPLLAAALATTVALARWIVERHRQYQPVPKQHARVVEIVNLANGYVLVVMKA
jgi:hypothetical protein